MSVQDGKIHVIIQKDKTNNEIYSQEESQGLASEKDKEKPSVAKQAIASALIQSGQQAISQGIDTYMQLSGNYQIGNAINTLTSVGADVLTIAKGGWVGAIAVGTKYALNIAKSYTDTYVQNREIEYNNQMLGVVSRKGSRYF